MSSEGQRIVQELDTSDEDAFPGRHRAPASVVRKVSARLGMAALGVLLATGLGVGTADVLGLSGGVQATAEAVPLRQVPVDRDVEPRPGRTVDLSAPPVLPPEASPVEELPADPSPERPAPAAAAAPADEPAAAPREPSPAPVRTVRTGDSCPTVGRTGVTGKGDAAVCTASPGNGPNKWRVA
jgi:hypothetical protein